MNNSAGDHEMLSGRRSPFGEDGVLRDREKVERWLQDGTIGSTSLRQLLRGWTRRRRRMPYLIKTTVVHAVAGWTRLYQFGKYTNGVVSVASDPVRERSLNITTINGRL